MYTEDDHDVTGCEKGGELRCPITEIEVPTKDLSLYDPQKKV